MDLTLKDKIVQIIYIYILCPFHNFIRIGLDIGFTRWVNCKYFYEKVEIDQMEFELGE